MFANTRNLGLMRTARRLCPAGACGRVGLRRQFSEATGAVVVVDGSQGEQEVLAEALQASGGHLSGVEFLSVGQLGIYVALRAIASLERDSRVPSFTFAGEDTIEGLRADVHVDENGARMRRRGRSYCLTLPPAEQWVDASARRAADCPPLLVGNATPIQQLAKAFVARTKAAPEGGMVTVETSLLGDAKRRLLRIAHMAQSIALAHHWQLSPREPQLSTRLFTCAAKLRLGAGGHAEALRVEVIPIGLPVIVQGSVPRASCGDTAGMRQLAKAL